MAKPPAKRKTGVATSGSPSVSGTNELKPGRANAAFDQVSNLLNEIGLVEGSFTITNGKSTLKGKSANGKAVNVILRNTGSGFREQTVSVCDVLTIEDRRAEARRLRSDGLRQTAIAAKLGVSQKTISDDLNS